MGNILQRSGKLKLAYRAYLRAEELEKIETSLSSSTQRPIIDGDSAKIAPFLSRVEKAEKYIFFLACNLFLVPIILGFLLHSWWIAIGMLLFGAILAIILIAWLLKQPYYLYDGFLPFIPASVIGFGWASVVWLSLPSNSIGIHIVLAIIGFLIGFFGNTFLFLLMDIFIIDDQLAHR
jgi:hypothetical protein